MKRISRGEAARLPHRALIHLVAASYGQDPERVSAWPADTFAEAVAYLPLTRG